MNNPSRPMRKLASLMVPLQEDTTSANIAFLPSGFKSARSELLKIGKYKSQWHVKMLETVDEAEFLFEDRMKMRVGKPHLESFCKEVLNCSSTGFPKLVNIRHAIDEAARDSLNARKVELGTKIRESLGMPEVQESAGKFFSVFGGHRIPSRAPSAVDMYDREIGVTSLMESVHGSLLTRGRVEMLYSAINDHGPAAIPTVHETLASTSVAASCYGHAMVFTAAYGKDGKLHESISLKGTSADEVVVPSCRMINESLVPLLTSTFTLPMLYDLKKTLKESDERVDLIESMM
jgi:hypothetical protein